MVEEHMKTIVIYKSKNGFTKKYAYWIARELEADLRKAAQVTLAELQDYDTIIYGGGLYAVGINGLKLITHNLDQLKKLNLIVFASGASSPKPEVRATIKKHNLPDNDEIKLFYLRGGFNFGKLSFGDKLAMLGMKLYLKTKKVLSEDDAGLLEAYNHPVDFCRKENIIELVNYVRSLEKVQR